MTLPIYQVDAFTDSAFRGNPAAICLLENKADAHWMQSLAAEMNLSETAFISKRDSINEFNLCWFTPKAEVDLCGHATLASAHILFESKRVMQNNAIVFHTRSGELKARIDKGYIEMNFPAQRVQPVEIPASLTKVLGTTPLHVAKSNHNFLVILKNETEVRKLKPDFNLLVQLPAQGIIVSAHADDKQYDFVSRYFAPGVGVDEDPVTGSAHCCFGPYWQMQTGKSHMRGLQVSKRSGEVIVHIKEDRVFLAGQAITIFKGELYV